MFYGQCCLCLLPRLLLLPSNHSLHLFLQCLWLEPLVLDHQHYLQDVLERCLPVMQVSSGRGCRWKRTLLDSHASAPLQCLLLDVASSLKAQLLR